MYTLITINMNEQSKISFWIRIFTLVAIILSFLVTYDTMIVRHDYNIIMNPDGPELDE